MQTVKEIRRVRDRQFVAAARGRGLRTVGGRAYLDDGLMVTDVAIFIGIRSDPLRVTWEVGTKPLALDDVLWAAFLPDLKFSPAKRRSLRVNGAFAAPSLELGRGEYLVPLDVEPASTIAAVLDAFESYRDEYLDVAPTSADFLEQIRARADGALPRPRARLREALALIVADRVPEAVALLQEELARGERGPMGGPNGGVFDLLVKHYLGGS